ncbi:3'(2'),5'-bisphosphate nucleotidase CysQ [Sphingobium aquiterrae]|uniref:3'(2'),5'-bisphosphate nucleotidase CysQ n=1 Tax=Sphingobium aquiterrae TaxID=2038656 RepID=UPI00301670A7
MLKGLIEAAIAGGEAILPIYRDLTQCQTRSKDDGSPVTIADEAAERAVVAVLARVAPGIVIVAEEECAAGNTPVTADRFLLVDPLDGTKEFVGGSGDFTVNIALIDHGVPVMGVVLSPATGAIYAGDADGARRGQVQDGHVIDWQPVQSAQAGESVRVIASRSHLTAETRDYCNRFPVGAFVSAGSSLKFCRVAEGAADLYPRMGRTMEWDTAAGDAVLRAAGGRVRTLDGNDLLYGKRHQADDADFANPWFVAHGGFDPFAVETRP